jgi:hypothetical protein
MLRLPDLTPHKHSEAIKRLGVAKVAKHIGITTSYLYGILSGSYKGTAKLQADIDRVMTDIIAEQ